MQRAIAIDGPAGSGKSTAAKEVSKKLGFFYVDTGAMYRAVAYFCIEKGIDMAKSADVVSAIKNIDLDCLYDNGVQKVILFGEDITKKLRTPKVGDGASKVGTIPEVRAFLVSLQQKIAEKYPVVMDGRDIGTVVLKNAKLKIYLTASADVRAKRRVFELKSLGEDCDFSKIKEEIILRDKRDKERKADPLRQAADAVLIDSSDMTINDVTEKIIDLAKERGI